MPSEFIKPVPIEPTDGWRRASDCRSIAEALEFQAAAQSLLDGDGPGAGALRPVNDVDLGMPATRCTSFEPGHLIAALA